MSAQSRRCARKLSERESCTLLTFCDDIDQCAPAINGSLWADESNFNGSICLSYTCMYANQLEGEVSWLPEVSGLDAKDLTHVA